MKHIKIIWINGKQSSFRITRIITLLILFTLLLINISLSENPIESEEVNWNLVSFGLDDVVQGVNNFTAISRWGTKTIELKQDGSGAGDIIIRKDDVKKFRIIHSIAGKKNGNWYLTPLRGAENSTYVVDGDFIYWNNSNSKYETYLWNNWTDVNSNQSVNVTFSGFSCDSLSVCNFKVNASTNKNAEDQGLLYMFLPFEDGMTFKIGNHSQTYNFSSEYDINKSGAEKLLYLFDEDGNSLFSFNFSDMPPEYKGMVKNISGNMFLLIGTWKWGSCTDCEWVIDPETTLYEENDYWVSCNNVKCYYIDSDSGGLVSNFKPTEYNTDQFAFIDIEANVSGTIYSYSDYNKTWYNTTSDDKAVLLGSIKMGNNHFNTTFILGNNSEHIIINSTTNLDATMTAIHKNITIGFDETNDEIRVWNETTQDFNIFELDQTLNYNFSTTNFYLNDFVSGGEIDVRWNGTNYQLFLQSNPSYYNTPVKLHSPTNNILFYWTDEATNEGIIINESADLSSLYLQFNENGFRDSNGKLHTIHTDTYDDLIYCYSSDEGFTWTCKEIRFGTCEYSGIIGDSKNNLYAFWEEDGDIDMMNSTDGGNSWSSVYTVADDSSSLTYATAAVDANDILHFAAKDSTSNFIYVNSTSFDTETIISFTQPDTVDIEIVNDTIPCVVVMDDDTSEDDIEILCANDGWTAHEVYDGGTLTYAYDGGTISTYEDKIYISCSDNADLQYCNGSINNLSSWSCKEIDSTGGRQSVIATDKDGNVNIIYNSGTSTGTMWLANSTDGSKGVNFNNHTQIADSLCGYGTIFNSNFPISNRIKDKLRIVYFNTSAPASIRYMSLDTPYTITPPTSVILNSSSLTNTTDENLTATAISDEDDITYYYNWLKNGKALSQLNMPMDNHSGTTYDYSGNEYHAEVKSAVYNGTGGIIGGAYEFDGQLSTLIEPASPADGFFHNEIKEITFMAWVYHIPDAVGADLIYEHGGSVNGFGLAWQKSDLKILYETCISSESNTISSTSTLNGGWMHIAATYNNGIKTLYINGINESNSTHGSTIPPNTNDPQIGGSDGNKCIGNYGWNGTIDEVKIFNISLSNSQIYELFIEANQSLNTSTWVSDETTIGDNYTVESWAIDSEGLNSSKTVSNWLEIISGEAEEDSCTYSGSGDWVITDACQLVNTTYNVCPNFINISTTGSLNVSGSSILNASRIIWYPKSGTFDYRLRWYNPSKVRWGVC